MKEKINRVDIQRVDELDLAKLQSLYIEAAAWMEAKGIDQWRTSDFTTEHMQKLIRQTELYQVNWSGSIIGGLSIQWKDAIIWKELDCDNEAGYLHKLVVKREYNGLGIGNTVLRWCEAYMKMNGKKLLRLDCVPSNVKLNEYYVTAGFEFRGRTEGKGWAANLYEKAVL